MRGLGNLTVKADDDIKLGGTNGSTTGIAGDTSAYGNLVLDAGDDIYAYGNLSSDTGNIDTYSSNYTTYLYGDVWTLDGHITFHNNVEARGCGNQRFDATLRPKEI